jgi:sensor domain DACNV-containing protein
MTEPAYPAARAIASRVESHFARHLAAARERGEDDLAPLPEARAVEAMLDAAFWASLRRVEDYSPTISLAFVSADQVSRPLRFERRLRLLPGSLARLAPAVERPGIHLGVWRDGEELHVWGATRTLPALCFVLEVVAPGLLVVKHRRRQDAAKFVNVAVLEGDQIKIVDERGTILPGCPPVLESLLGGDASASTEDDSINVPMQLAVSMRAHQRGGALLVVPAGSDAWRQSIVRPVSYSLVPTPSDVAHFMRCDPAERARIEWQESLRRAVDALAGLTAVDGATIITDQYELLAFGAKLRRRDDSDQVEHVLLTEPIEGASTATVDPAELGGTRHLSAAQFVHDQRDAAALVASQDGRFTIFAWSAGEQIVRAHRIEALLM